MWVLELIVRLLCYEVLNQEFHVDTGVVVLFFLIIQYNYNTLNLVFMQVLNLVFCFFNLSGGLFF